VEKALETAMMWFFEFVEKMSRFLLVWSQKKLMPYRYPKNPPRVPKDGECQLIEVPRDVIDKMK